VDSCVKPWEEIESAEQFGSFSVDIDGRLIFSLCNAFWPVGSILLVIPIREYSYNQ